MKVKVIAFAVIIVMSGLFTGCSEEDIQPNTDRKDMAKGSSKQEDKW